MFKYKLGVVLLMLIAVTACSGTPTGGDSGNDSVFNDVIKPGDNNSSSSQLAATTVINITQIGDTLEILAKTKEGYKLYKGPVGNGLLSLDQGVEVILPLKKALIEAPRTSISKTINGYMAGTYYVEAINPSKSTIKFVDEALGQHLDLLEIDHLPNEFITDVVMDSEFSTIVYTKEAISDQVLEVTRFMHNLATNELTIIGDEANYLLVTDDFGLYEVNRIIKNGILEVGSKTTSAAVNPGEDSKIYDKVISNGIVMDPDTNSIKVGYDIGIMGDTISTITNVALKGEEVIDATGLIVSPGFIDMLGFNLTPTVAKYKITDGVTTNLSLHGCTVHFESWFNSYDSNPPYINYGGAIFAVKIRYERGLGANGTPTEEDIAYMANRVREEIEAGGLTLSFSPEYYPGTTPEEIRAMMAVAAEYDIPTHFHARYSSLTGEFTGIDGVVEVLGYARELNARVQFMHLHSTGGTGAMDEALALINEARAEGVRVTYDIYPYDSWASNIDWQRYRPGWQERYGITYSDLQMAGTTERLTEETFNYYRSVGGLCIAFAMDEGEMVQALSEPYAMVGSDGNIEREDAANNHFRGAGTFSRVLGKYVRDANAFSLMDGLRKMTINGAKHLEPISKDMALRGRLQEGCIADITIFDYRTVLDQSTPEKPATPSAGIHYVIVAGQVGLNEQGVITSQHAGRPIKSSF
jgi:cytosine/adenosine deaminase-related metal-dependent hydrolase